MADEKKLDKWAELLLDTGKRNNLINFKDTKASTAEVVLPYSDILFEKIDGNTSFVVFDPQITDEEDIEENPGSEHAESEDEKVQNLKDKESFIEKYSSKLKRQISF